MAGILGMSKTIQTDCTKLKKKMEEVIPHINPTDDLTKVFTEGEFALKTKKDRDEAVKKVKLTLAERFGLKINDIALQGLLESVGNDAIELTITQVRDEDIECMLEQMSEKISQKLRYAVQDMPKIGIRLTFKGDSCVPLCVIKLDEDSVWYPGDLKGEETGALSEGDCMKINNFVLTALYETYPNQYTCVVTGPKGGTLEVGLVYTKNKKPEGEKIRKEMSGGCSIEY